MVGIGLMKKHLVLYNRVIRSQYLIKGISKMKADEVKKNFNYKLKPTKIKDNEYYFPIDNQKNFNQAIGSVKRKKLFMELIDNNLKKTKEKVKKQAVKSNAPEPIPKKKADVVKPVVKKKKKFKISKKGDK